MRFLPAFDIWAVPTELLAAAQPGQHVFAGDPRDRNARGRLWGVKRSGPGTTVVVAWSGNTRTRKTRADQADYHRALRAYALGR